VRHFSQRCPGFDHGENEGNVAHQREIGHKCPNDMRLNDDLDLQAQDCPRIKSYVRDTVGLQAM
jgi:hypothetical protein